MISPINQYERYCQICQENESQPVWFDDAFLNEGTPSSGQFSGNADHIIQYSSARVVVSKSSFSGGGRLTLILGFAACLENINITVSSGDLTLFVGPYSEIKNLVIQSFDVDNYIFFGSGNTLNTGNLLVQGEGSGIFFGHDCMFSTNIHGRTSDSHSIFSYSTGVRINNDASIRIGDHCWIGRSVIINKGVWAEDDIVFGQGSVINGRFDGAACFAGVPARKIKSGITWERARLSKFDEIPSTYYYRPRQFAVNSFLLKDSPFHPRATSYGSQVREKYIVSKAYKWIPPIIDLEI